MLNIKSSTGIYDVNFVNDINNIQHIIQNSEDFIIVDDNVRVLYPSLFQGKSLISFVAMESNKSPEYAMILCRELMNRGINRKSKLLVVGGGITQDASSFIASILFRGIEWNFIPTTLLAHTDSCIGGKTGLNFDKYKNVLGTFYPPKHIWVCEKFLNTLNIKDFCSGMGEVMKFMILDGNGGQNFLSFYRELDGILNQSYPIKSYVEIGLNLKARLIESDEFDNGVRQYLNYGHTFGHAIEASTDYYVPHGIAIISGMKIANRISVKLGMMNKELYDKISYVGDKIIYKTGLYKYVGSNRYVVDHIDELLDKTRKDKKNLVSGDVISMVLVDNDFKCHKMDISHTLVKESLINL